MVNGAGQVIAGAAPSTTVTSWVQEEVFPASSVAVQVTIVSPTGRMEGASLTMVIPLASEQLSDAVAFPMDPL